MVGLELYLKTLLIGRYNGNNRKRVADTETLATINNTIVHRSSLIKI